MSILNLIGRSQPLFSIDLQNSQLELSEQVHGRSFLVLGGAGSIGQAVTKEIFRRKPKRLHVVDLSENNLTELVRDIRSSLGYIKGDFRTFTLDICSPIYDEFTKAQSHYDYVLNLSALKHVRSEKDPYTLMRMIEVNILNTEKTLIQAKKNEAKKYFCVSTDKAANPVNMMGASKCIMEKFLMRHSGDIPISTARFANVAFSDGSLLHGFRQRIQKQQPIAAPNDIRRYFLTPQESGELCLMSCILGHNRDIFFPKLSEEFKLITFADIAKEFILSNGYEPHECSTEEEARHLMKPLLSKGKWPCYFSESDTTGEKAFEEFFTEKEQIDMERFTKIGIVKSMSEFDHSLLENFLQEIQRIKSKGAWKKEEVLELFYTILPEFDHDEKGKSLDNKM
ncbi:UDP-N-acetylglucosamine 4,6-dehydratase [Flavobacteriales bacterium]|nr:UDP-N-acetylglucosamine 4,6-dehydratase [Flavobacteriales bacterium]